MDSSISAFKLILRPKDFTIVFDKNHKICGFMLVFPSISNVVTKYKGKMSLGFIREFLQNKRHPRIIDLGLIGVLPEYTMLGVAAVMAVEFSKLLINTDIEHLETNLMLEENHQILGLMEHFEKETTKKRRCFVKKI